MGALEDIEKAMKLMEDSVQMPHIHIAAPNATGITRCASCFQLIEIKEN